ncbi:DUF1826 domain-containing protein [Paracoccaceae bacterium]|nr:DUF1826 domain-containing protein [Paracoccaceae bacterium]
MTILHKKTKKAVFNVGVGVVRAIQDLAVIRDPGCAVALCQRQPDRNVLEWLERLDSDRLPKARVILPPDRINDALEQICDISDTPDCEKRKRLIDDVTKLAKVFADLMKTAHLRLRFDVVTTNSCKKFHIDRITARLLCTYRGTGTQYGFSVDGTEPDHILTVPTGSPIVLRGSLWPETPKSGILHRSPPIEGTGEYRSVLVLDPIFDLEKEM